MISSVVPRNAWLDGRPSRRAAMSLGNKKSASLSLNLCLCQYQSSKSLNETVIQIKSVNITKERFRDVYRCFKVQK